MMESIVGEARDIEILAAAQTNYGMPIGPDSPTTSFETVDHDRP
jgi:hypothetical protein